MHCYTCMPIWFYAIPNLSHFLSHCNVLIYFLLFIISPSVPVWNHGYNNIQQSSSTFITLMTPNGSIKTMCYDWMSWALKGIDFHLPPIKSSDNCRAFAGTLHFTFHFFSFVLKYSGVSQLPVKIQPIRFLYLCIFRKWLCIHYGRFVHNLLTAAFKSSDIVWRAAVTVLAKCEIAYLAVFGGYNKVYRLREALLMLCCCVEDLQAKRKDRAHTWKIHDDHPATVHTQG